MHDKVQQKDVVKGVGQIKIVNFLSPQYLRRVGNGFSSNGRAGQNVAGILDNFVPATGSNGKIRQSALELSNVDLTNEFASMISPQRSFQAGQVHKRYLALIRGKLDGACVLEYPIPNKEGGERVPAISEF